MVLLANLPLNNSTMRNNFNALTIFLTNRYLLDELIAYETGCSDMLSPVRNTNHHHLFMGESQQSSIDGATIEFNQHRFMFAEEKWGIKFLQCER